MRKFLLTVVFAFIALYAFAQERIAVFPFEDRNNVLTRDEAVRFYRTFYNEFTNTSTGRFSLVPLQEIERLISTEAVFQHDDFFKGIQMSQMMLVQNATLILSGTIGRLGDNIGIFVYMYKYPELAYHPAGTSLIVTNTNELFNKIPELIQNMHNEIAAALVEPVPQGLEYEIVDGMAVTITRYRGNAERLNIPSRIEGLPVTVIGNSAFRNNYRLKSVTLPSTVTHIGNEAFAVCTSLSRINIPSSVTTIGNGAFAHCVYLRNVIIPPSVTSIGNSAFFLCSNIEYLIIPSSVTSIGSYAFAYCRLKEVTIPSSVTYLGAFAFSDCTRLTSITLSRNTQVGEYAYPPRTQVIYSD